MSGIEAELDLRPDFDWLLMRLVTSEKITDSRLEIESEWTMLDVLEAHEALDVIEDLQVLADRRLRPPGPARGV